ncbi:MAG: quinol:electron acceptor oxidoreductase subunit ActD [Planctomycetota bacterium]|jgi:mono/diheme cytochrome c family protein
MSNDTSNAAPADREPEVHGLLAQFEDVDTLCSAASKVRDAGYEKWDCHTPFPVHGLDDHMGVKFTKLPWVVLAMGLTGLGAGMLLQWWTNAVDYAYDISGKPAWSVPANIPVTFEVTVLFSAFTAFFAMWIMNGLPKWYNPLLRKERFARATDDKFFVAIEAEDPLYDGDRTAAFLSELGASHVETVEVPDEPTKLPGDLVGKLVVFCTLLLVPPAMVYNAYHKTSDQPRVHLIKDMDKQDRFRPQGSTSLFEDGRMSRQPVAATVAQGELRLDSAWYEGKDGPDYVDLIPMQVDEATLERGRERFAIYCAPCHGHDGRGQGTVHQRATLLTDQGLAQWVPPTDLAAERILEQPAGQIYETIAKGRNNMPAYNVQIPVEARWAIVAYTQALGLAQAEAGPSDAELAEMTPAQRGELLFVSKTCNACHKLDGSRLVGPPMNGRWGTEVPLADGTTVLFDEAYVTESIKEPMAKISADYPPAMAPLPVSDEEIADLIEYLKTLE